MSVRRVSLGLAAFALCSTVAVAQELAAPPPAPAEEASPAQAKFASEVIGLLGRPGGLQSEVVAQRAADTSFEVLARQHEVEAATAGVEQAAVAYFPRLGVNASYTRLSDFDPPALGAIPVAIDPSTGQPAKEGPIGSEAILYNAPFKFPVLVNSTMFRAVLTVPVSDYLLRISKAYGAATHSEQAAKLNEQAARLATATNAKVAYYAWVRAKLQVVVAQAAVEQSRDRLNDVRPAYNIGAASKADVMRFEAQLANAQLLLERTRNAASVLEERLRVVMHDANRSATYEIGEAFPEAPLDVPGMGAPEAVFDAAEHHRLEVKVFEQQIAALDQQAKLAKAGYFPRLDLVGDVTTANPNPRVITRDQQWNTTWSAGVALSWAPNDLFTSKAQRTAALAREAQMSAQLQALLDGLRTEVFQATQDVRETQMAMETTSRALAAAEEAYRVRTALFRAGRATATELSDAETDLTRARFENMNARVDSRIARVRFIHATGQDAT